MTAVAWMLAIAAIVAGVALLAWGGLMLSGLLDNGSLALWWLV